MAGGICPESYRRYGIDNHIHDIFDLLSLLGHHRRIFLPDVIFEHINVTKNEHGPIDYVPEQATHQLDIKLFESLLDNRKAIALEAMRLIDGRLKSETNQTWKKKLDLVTDPNAIRRPEHTRWFPISRSPSGRTPRVTIGVVS